MSASEVVVAGAGTGKTHALVRAYLAALLGLDQGGQVRSPARVLAITFTDKAAAEMRARVQKALAALVRGELDLSDEVKRFDCALPKKRDIERLLQKSASAPISTFHSLCHTLLRDFASHRNLDPGFQLASERELQELLLEVCERCVLDRLATEDVHVAELTARFGLRRMGFGRGLVDELIDVHRKLAEQGLFAADLGLVVTSEVASARVAEIHRELREAVREINVEQKSANQLIRKLAGPLIRDFIALDEALDLGRGTEAEIELAEAFVSFRQRVREAFGQGALLEAREQAAALTDRLGQALTDRVTAPHAGAVRELLMSLETRARDEKIARGVLGFGDLLVETRALLEEPSIRARVKARYDRVLVDEFQDTSPIQEDIVALLAERSAVSAAVSPGERPMGVLDLEPGRLFVVGDPRQSIYAFRGADARIFGRTYNAVVRPEPPREPSGTRRILQKSFRSRAAVIALVNHVANVSLPKKMTRAPLIPERELDDDVEHAGAHWVPASRPTGVDALTLEARVLANGVRALLDKKLRVYDKGARMARAVTPRDIAVLVRRVRASSAVARALSHVGIPAQILGGEGFFARAEISDLLAILRLVVEPDDELATLTALRSPLVAARETDIVDVISRERRAGWTFVCERAAVFGDARARVERLARVLSTLRDDIAELTCPEMIDRVLDEGGYLEVLGALPDAALAYANVQKLRGMVDHRPGAALASITRFWSWLDDPPRESLADTIDPAADAVSILTMHRSKGLEWPVVVLADLDTRPPRFRDQVAFDPELGLAVTYRGRPVEVCAPPRGALSRAAIDTLAQVVEARESEERARLLYVAMTRARDHLFVVGDAKLKTPSSNQPETASMRELLNVARSGGHRAKFDALLPMERIDPELGPARPPKEQRLPDEIAPEPVRAAERARVLPSALVGASTDLDSFERVRALQRGRAAHRLVALVGACHDPELLEDEALLRLQLEAVARLEGLEPEASDARELLSAAARTLSGPIARLIRDGFTLSFEEILEAEGPRARWVGTADLVARKGALTWVIDFKSTKRAADDPATVTQLVAYAAATGDDDARIAAWVIGDEDPSAPLPIEDQARRRFEDALEEAAR